MSFALKSLAVTVTLTLSQISNQILNKLIKEKNIPLRNIQQVQLEQVFLFDKRVIKASPTII